MFCKVSQNSQEKPVLESLEKSSRPRAGNVIKKETPTSVLSCKFCKTFKDTFFIDHLPVTASERSVNLDKICVGFLFIQ